MTALCARRLDLVHGVDVAGLDKVLKLFDFLCELLHRHLLVLHGAHHLQLLDAVADGDELVGAPKQTIHLDALDGGEHCVVVSLVVPWLVDNSLAANMGGINACNNT